MPTLSQNKALPVAIVQLRLCSALRNCGKTGVENAFDKSNDENLYIYDDESLHHSDWTNVRPAFSSKTFHAQNPNNNTLVLLPLDGCVITGRNIIQGGVCDCVLLTEKEMSFVEFKTNVTSINDDTVLQRANEAAQQLWHTYDGIIKPKCEAVGTDIKQKVSIDFYIVFDKDFNVTGAQASLQDLQNEFLVDKYYPLYFQNNKQFE